MRFLQEMTTNPQQVAVKDSYALVIGAANIDICGYSAQRLKTHESNPGKLDISVGGVGRNIADNLARLGADSRLLSILGDDHWGQQILNLTRQAGVNVELCVRRENARSSTYLSLHDPDGEMQLALSDMGIIDTLNSDDLLPSTSQINNADVLVLDANLSDAALSHCFSYKHPTVFVDPVSSVKAIKLKPYLAMINTLKPNHLEAELLSGVAITTATDVAIAAKVLHQKGVENVFISSGALGGFWSTDFGVVVESIPIAAVIGSSVVNVTGAGDALMAALVYGCLNDWDQKKRGRFAMAASAVTVSVDSTINPDLNELLVLQVMEQNVC